jgi:hypothetical protein
VWVRPASTGPAISGTCQGQLLQQRQKCMYNSTRSTCTTAPEAKFTTYACACVHVIAYACACVHAPWVVTCSLPDVASPVWHLQEGSSMALAKAQPTRRAMNALSRATAESVRVCASGLHNTERWV